MEKGTKMNNKTANTANTKSTTQANTEIIRRFHLKAQNAMPGPPLASALSKYKLPIPQLCKEFNEKTKQFTKDLPVVAIVRITQSKTGYSATIEAQTPTVSSLLKEELKAKKFSSTPGRQTASSAGSPSYSLTLDAIDRIVDIKFKNLTAANRDAARKTIASTAKSAGIEVPEL